VAGAKSQVDSRQPAASSQQDEKGAANKKTHSVWAAGYNMNILIHNWACLTWPLWGDSFIFFLSIQKGFYEM